MRFIGVDYGKAKIGVALSDEGGHMGFPHSVIDNTKEASEVILKIAQEENAGGVVLGISKAPGGEENEIVGDIKKFAKELNDLGIETYFQDESFTTLEAGRYAVGKERKDASAAALILSRFLEKK